MQLTLKKATLLKRYKRFLADIELPNGVKETIYVPNTGKMTSCIDDLPLECFYSTSTDTKRKYTSTLEFIKTKEGALIDINTHRANQLAYEFLNQHQDFLILKKEIKEGDSRFDFLVEYKGQKKYLEVKSVTLKTDNLSSSFPDTISARAFKHIEHLDKIGGIVLFVINRSDVQSFTINNEIDKKFSQKLLESKNNHRIQVMAYQSNFNFNDLRLEKEVHIYDS